MTRRIRHLHLPRRRRAAAAAQQFDPPARESNSRHVDVARGQRGDPPAGQGRARPLAFGQRLRAIAPPPQHKGGDAGALGGELQPAAGDHRQPPDLADHGGKAGGAQPLLHRPQELVVAFGADQHQAGGIEPVREEPRPVQIRPRQAPQHRTSTKAGEDAGDKAGSGGAILLIAALPKDLVHGAEREAAARQGAVDRREAKGQHAMPRRRLDLPDPIAKRRETGRWRHAPWETVPHQIRKAHLFTCFCRENAGSWISCRPGKRSPLWLLLQRICSQTCRFGTWVGHALGLNGLFSIRSHPYMFSVWRVVNPARFAVKMRPMPKTPQPPRPAGETDAAEITARILLETESVLFRPEDPFTFTSGRQSPVYIDCRRLISFPRARKKLMDMGAELIERRAGYEGIDAIAGGETAGIPFAAWIADRLSLPMLYVRKQAKGFGRDEQIEGDLKDGSRVLLVEDLASEGTSKLNFVRAIRQAGGVIDHAFVIFNYGIFPQIETSLAAEGITLLALATWWDVAQTAERLGRFGPGQYAAIESFLKDPNGWSKTRVAAARR